MEYVLSFLIAFCFSFIGTIPPGTLNLSIIQLGLDNKISAAWRFALAAGIIEYPYAWLAVKFEDFITSSPVIIDNFQIITAAVMLSLGTLSLWMSRGPASSFAVRFHESGFRRGIVLALLNPLALPFWVAMTAYIKAQGWIDLSTSASLHLYLFGVSLGSLTLLMAIAYLAKNVVKYFRGNVLLKKIPGFTLLLLGTYALVRYLL